MSLGGSRKVSQMKRSCQRVERRCSGRWVGSRSGTDDRLWSGFLSGSRYLPLPRSLSHSMTGPAELPIDTETLLHRFPSSVQELSGWTERDGHPGTFFMPMKRIKNDVPGCFLLHLIEAAATFAVEFNACKIILQGLRLSYHCLAFPGSKSLLHSG